MAYTLVVAGAPLLNGPLVPNRGSTKCYALFSGNGPVSNLVVSSVIGDVGTNIGLTSGFDALLVTGANHAIADGSTAQCTTDLHIMYDSLNTLPADIELLYPAPFGQNLVLTPHTYLLNAATALIDSLYLNAMGNANAVLTTLNTSNFHSNIYFYKVMENDKVVQSGKLISNQ